MNIFTLFNVKLMYVCFSAHARIACRLDKKCILSILQVIRMHVCAARIYRLGAHRSAIYAVGGCTNAPRLRPPAVHQICVCPPSTHTNAGGPADDRHRGFYDVHSCMNSAVHVGRSYVPWHAAARTCEYWIAFGIYKKPSQCIYKLYAFKSSLKFPKFSSIQTCMSYIGIRHSPCRIYKIVINKITIRSRCSPCDADL